MVLNHIFLWPCLSEHNCVPICWAGVEDDGCSIAGDALKLNRRALRSILPALWDFDVPSDPPLHP